MRYLPLIFLLGGCVSMSQARANGIHEALNAVTDYADPAYSLAIRTCELRGQSIVDRTGTTEEEDREDFDQLRTRCDAIFGSFEALIVLQEQARATVEIAKNNEDAAALDQVQALLISIASAWRDLRLALEQAGLLGTR